MCLFKNTLKLNDKTELHTLVSNKKKKTLIYVHILNKCLHRCLENDLFPIVAFKWYYKMH